MQKTNQQIQACLNITKQQKENNENQKDYIEMVESLLQEIQALITYYDEIASCELAAFRGKDELTQCLMQLIEDLEASLSMPIQILKKTRFYETIDEDLAEIDDWIEEMNECIAPARHLGYIESWDIGYFF